MGLLDLLFPRRCVSCGRVGDYLCNSCILQIPWHTEAKCLVCSRRAIGGYSHPKCLGEWGLDRAILIAHYRGPIRRLVTSLKYKRITNERNLIVKLIAERLDRRELKDFVVTAVPLHFTRQISRGFNQSELVGKSLAGWLNLLYKDNLLYRPSKSLPQVELDRVERGRNVRGAFRVYEKSGILGAKVLLFDDVITTGSTVKECAKILKRAGAKEVWALALAHG